VLDDPALVLEPLTLLLDLLAPVALDDDFVPDDEEEAPEV
jgi:hypothetical protein